NYKSSYRDDVAALIANYPLILRDALPIFAPIMTEPGGPAWRQTTFYPFADTARHGRGQVLQLPLTCPSHDTAQYGTVPLLHATADRKSTRLNSSHVKISYAVFCLQNKKHT